MSEVSAAEVSQVENQARSFLAQFERLKAEIQKVIVGNDDVIEAVLTCLLADGHVLLEGVPGLGKTMLVRTLAEVVGLEYGRIQFTPDLMPADIIGTNLIVDTDTGREFRFQKGPIFTNILLADEVNRATPKTQSALLQAMAEYRVTVGNHTYPIPPPYFVMATQNPLEMEGTYPLPEAQLDRFMFKVHMPFPDLDDLSTIMDRTISGHKPDIGAVTTQEALISMRAIGKRVPIAKHVQRYALRILQRTHPTVADAPDSVKRYVSAGASPRGGQSMLSAARIRALVRGETAVSFDDVREVALPSMRHRILLNFEGEAEGVKTDELLLEIIKTTKKS